VAGGKVEVGQYRRHSAEFKAKVALEAIKGQRTLNEIAGEYGVHPGQIIQWKKQVLEVYLKDYEMVPSAVANLKDYFQFYNRERLYQSLGDRTPETVYRGWVA
jgi:putative transposase